MMPQAYIKSLSFADGTQTGLPASGTVVFVGPNNAGKSTALQDIQSAVQVGNDHADHLLNRRVVKRAVLATSGDVKDLGDWLASHAGAIVRGSPGSRFMQLPSGVGIQESDLEQAWGLQHGLGSLAGVFMMPLHGEGRLRLTQQVPIFDRFSASPANPLQAIFANHEKEKLLSEAVREALGKGVAVNRGAGSDIHLHLGEIDSSLELDPYQAGYLEAFRELEEVQHQGDGVKSLVGLLMAIYSGQYQLIVIDEPEAFLHPPQARLLGTKLAQQAKGAQVFVATHSADVLRGVLDADASRVTVVRLDRNSESGTAMVLEHEALEELWSDPILRFSAVFEGLFHRGVVLCESDADCRFYQAVLDSHNDREGKVSPDLLFSHCGGKDRIRTALAALTAVGVPSAVIADLDYLRNESVLRDTIELLGGSWRSVERDYRIVVGNLQPASPASTKDVQIALEQILKENVSAELSRASAKQIRTAIKIESGWDVLKSNGVAGCPPGQATEAMKSLLSQLSGIGIHLVEVGELENWDREVGNHGPRWVSGALERGLHRQHGPHSEFVARIAAGLTPADSAHQS